MKILKAHLYDYAFKLLVVNAQLMYCLKHYDEMLKELNDELDNCNYFGEELCHDNILR